MGCGESTNNHKENIRPKAPLNDTKDEKSDPSPEEKGGDIDFDIHSEKGKVDILKPMDRKKKTRQSKILELDTVHGLSNQKALDNSLKQSFPDFDNIENERVHSFWLEWNIKLFGIIKKMNCYNLTKLRILSLHDIITYYVSVASNITFPFRNSFKKYLDSIWEQNPEAFEVAFHELDELLTVSNIDETKNIDDLIAVFEESKESILKDLVNTPHIGESEYDLDLFHGIVKKYMEESDFEKYFSEIKKCLINYKHVVTSRDAIKSRLAINKIKMLFAFYEVTNTKSLKSISGQFDDCESIFISCVLSMDDPPVEKKDLVEFNKRIRKIMISDTPFYAETTELLRFYLKSAYLLDRALFLSCVTEFGKIFPTFEDVLNGRITVNFTGITNKSSFIDTWKAQEKALMLLESKVKDYHRRDIRDLHNYIYYTIDLDYFSVIDIRDQLIKYHEVVMKGDTKAVSHERHILIDYLVRDNVNDDKNYANKERPGRPSFLSVKNTSLSDAWMNFYIDPYCKRIVTQNECPINRITIKILTSIIIKKLKDPNVDFKWMKRLMQDFADNLWDKRFDQLEDNFEDLLNYKIFA